MDFTILQSHDGDQENKIEFPGLFYKKTEQLYQQMWFKKENTLILQMELPILVFTLSVRKNVSWFVMLSLRKKDNSKTSGY